MSLTRETALTIKTLDAVKNNISILRALLDSPSEFEKQIILRKLDKMETDLPRISRKLTDMAEKRLKQLITETNLSEPERGSKPEQD